MLHVALRAPRNKASSAHSASHACMQAYAAGTGLAPLSLLQSAHTPMDQCIIGVITPVAGGLRRRSQRTARTWSRMCGKCSTRSRPSATRWAALTHERLFTCQSTGPQKRSEPARGLGGTAAVSWFGYVFTGALRGVEGRDREGADGRGCHRHRGLLPGAALRAHCAAHRPALRAAGAARYLTLGPPRLVTLSRADPPRTPELQ